MVRIRKQLCEILSRFRRRPRSARLRKARAGVERLEQRELLTIDIVFDYTYDSSGFFNPPARRETLEAAAAVYEARVLDDLSAITPGDGDTWAAIFDDPSNLSQVNIVDLTVPEDTIIVYVGARDLAVGVGEGGPGGFSANSTQSFATNLQTRGETGVDPNSSNDTDFAMWGGTIAFDDGTNWNFELNQPTSEQTDLYSVAVHELGHIFGFGTAESFRNQINSANEFTGAKASAAFGGPVAMNEDRFGNPDQGHFASNTESLVPGTNVMQESVFDPEVAIGARKQLTEVDWAAIDDIGWELAPFTAPTDFGDAPDASNGTGPGNYQTRFADNGPSHTVVAGLFIGDSVDADDGLQNDVNATADDVTGEDDEDFALSDSLFIVEGVNSKLDVNVTNTLGATATLYGWIDFDQDGLFEVGERSSAVPIAPGTENETVALTFAAATPGTAGETIARFRLSTDTSASEPVGPAIDGEVEDHRVTILTEATAYDSLRSFSWPETSGAVRYEVEVNNLTTGEDQVILQSYLTKTGFRPPTALTAGVYNWRYRPHDGTDFLPWSEFVSFQIFARTTGSPFITDPIASSVDSLPTIAWSPVESATRYELWVNGTSKQRVIHQTNLSGTSFTPQTGLEPDTYTAWVRAFDGKTQIDKWSEAFTFTLATSNVSVLTEPIGSSYSTAPTFAWLPMNVPSYELRIDQLSTSQPNFLVETGLTGTSFTPKSGLPPGQYQATITGLNSNPSKPVSFQIQNVSGQAEFTVTSGNSENPLPKFHWTSVTGADRYELWVDDVIRGVSRVIHSSNLTDTVFTATQALSPSTYRAWVRAFHGSTPTGIWSDSIDYVVRESSTIPTIWSPVDSSANTAPTFAWSSVANATHYEVDIQHGRTLLQTQKLVADNFLALNFALDKGTHTATVRAYNETKLLGSDSRRFIVTDGSEAIENFGPEMATNRTRPTFSWSSVESATRYFLWVNDDTRKSVGTLLQSNIQSTTFTPDTPLLPGSYRYWVRAYDGASPVGEWSSVTKFEVTEVTEAPLITAPLPTTTNSVPPITWTAVANAATYEVEIHNSQSLGTPMVIAEGIPTTVYRPSPLPPGVYHVRVRSVDGSGTPSVWSRDVQLTIEPVATAELVSPLPDSTTPMENLNFAWTTVTNAVRYELWVNDLTSGVVRTIHQTSLTDISFSPESPLAAGDYRAWVRAIGADGTPGLWSAAVNFIVTSS